MCRCMREACTQLFDLRRELGALLTRASQLQLIEAALVLQLNSQRLHLLHCRVALVGRGNRLHTLKLRLRFRKLSFRQVPRLVDANHLAPVLSFHLSQSIARNPTMFTTSSVRLGALVHLATSRPLLQFCTPRLLLSRCSRLTIPGCHAAHLHRRREARAAGRRRARLRACAIGPRAAAGSRLGLGTDLSPGPPVFEANIFR